ncbi:MAG TPA: LuxR C-terminal-related transcriptional regulator [Terriglobales bacterium]|nr:LuxR C-terminal-related transcriptional regulator [Terriglobales bacterium]
MRKLITILTPLQKDVARCVAEGMTNKEIAAKFHFSRRSIEYHIFRCYQFFEISRSHGNTRVKLATMVASDPTISYGGREPAHSCAKRRDADHNPTDMRMIAIL